MSNSRLCQVCRKILWGTFSTFALGISLNIIEKLNLSRIRRKNKYWLKKKDNIGEGFFFQDYGSCYYFLVFVGVFWPPSKQLYFQEYILQFFSDNKPLALAFTIYSTVSKDIQYKSSKKNNQIHVHNLLNVAIKLNNKTK